MFLSLDGAPCSTSTTKPTENTFVPGLIRVEPGMGEGGQVDGDTWVEWEIILSRFFPTKIRGAGTYLTLRKSIPVPTGGEYGGNNQVRLYFCLSAVSPREEFAFPCSLQDVLRVKKKSYSYNRPSTLSLRKGRLFFRCRHSCTGADVRTNCTTFFFVCFSH